MKRFAILIITLALLPATAFADDPTGSGFKWLSPPPDSVATGEEESDTQMFVFAEQTNFMLPSSITVDFTMPGTYDQSSDLDGKSAVIPAGTLINSYYVHADQSGSGGSAIISATITFPDDILGVILTPSNLGASQSVVGLSGTTYPTGNAIGYELSGPCPASAQDCATLDNNRRTLTLETTIYNVVDDLRVITRGAYGVCVLYDQTKAHKSGSTVPIKLQLCGADGTNLSSADHVVHARNLTRIDNSASAAVEDAGNANPDDDFRYDAALGETGGYIYNLSTDGLTTGTYRLSFTVDGHSDTTYVVSFDVK